MRRTRKRFRLTGSLMALALAGAVGASAQAPAGKTPSYEVVSIKTNVSGDPNSGKRTTLDRFSGTNVTLKMLLELAYGIKAENIAGGPSWVDSQHFDLTATMVDADPGAVKRMSPTERGAMLRPALAERFHLKVHPETKIQPIYALVIAKGGSKLVETTQPDTPFHDQKAGTWGIHATEMTGHDVPLTPLVTLLEYLMHRTVVDKTGLKGHYDLLLRWSRDDAPPSADSTAPSVETALQEQMGLKLEPGKGPVETLVIDQVDKPTED